MGRWILKAAIQGVISILPDSQRWNRVFQTRVTHSTDLNDERFLAKWSQAERHIADWEGNRGAFAGANVLELGTGWLPIVPVAMVLNGAGRVMSVDKQDVLTHDCVVATLDRIDRLIAAGAIRVRSTGALERLHAVLQCAPTRTARELLLDLGITCILGDARQLGLPAASVDLFVSNNTLEHIPSDILSGILSEFARVASPRAIGSHHVDMADHYAHFDHSLSVYNFLRYSDGIWRLFNNRLQYQNRLRVNDFRALQRDAGWELIAETNTTGPDGELGTIRVAPRFRNIPTADLAVITSWFVAVPVAAAIRKATSAESSKPAMMCASETVV